MAFCKYCGKKLEDGEVCSCPEAKADREGSNDNNGGEDSSKDLFFNAENNDPVPAPDPSPEKADTEPSQEPEIVNKEKENDDTSGKGGLKKRLTGIAILAGILLVILILGAALISMIAGAYKKPFKNIQKGIEKKDAAAIVEAFYPDSYISYMEDSVEDYEDSVDELDSLIDDLEDVLQDDYFGDGMKIDIEYIEKEEVSGKTLKSINNHFKAMGESVNKAYKVKINLMISGDEKTCEGKINNLYSVKLESGEWKLYIDERAVDRFNNEFSKPLDILEDNIESYINGYKDSLDLVLASPDMEDDEEIDADIDDDDETEDDQDIENDEEIDVDDDSDDSNEKNADKKNNKS